MGSPEDPAEQRLKDYDPSVLEQMRTNFVAGEDGFTELPAETLREVLIGYELYLAINGVKITIREEE